MYELFLVIVAYILADAFSGIYHMVTDLGYNIPSQVAFFQKHHAEPWTMTFDLQPVLGGVPLIIIGLFYLHWFFIPFGLFIAFAQIPHYFIHHKENVPGIVRWLQNNKVILSPEVHESHHSGDFDKNYCIISGWNDWWLNKLARKIHRK